MKVRILVVDDESEIRDMLSRHFRYLGYEVDIACNGKEALEIIQKSKTDIVISDIKMPVMDGIELLRVIKLRFPMIHTIMITGYVTLENVLACMRHGADTCIFKPLENLNHLEDAVSLAVKTIQHWLDILQELTTMKPDIDRI